MKINAYKTMFTLETDGERMDYFNECVNLMDMEIKDELDVEYDMLSDVEYMQLYCQKHFEKFGKQFIV